MLSRAAVRASSSTSMVARRGFHSTRAQMGSPYHYPEGPRSNIPFNPNTRFFALRYWDSWLLDSVSWDSSPAEGHGGLKGTTLTSSLGAPFGVAVWQTYKNQ
ncbi:cytochrome-c oxidase chain VIIc [Botrytis cinerea]